MVDFLIQNYFWIKAFHVISVISWMAGVFYLPRLFVYHAEAEPGSDITATFKVMESRLLRIIIRPAMVMTLISGLALAGIPGVVDMKLGWFHVKLILVFLLLGYHGFLEMTVKRFKDDLNSRSSKFYRAINEIPPLIMIVIVIMVIVKPF